MTKTKTRLWMMAPALAGVLTLSCGNVPQPKPGCAIGQGPFAAKYTPKAGEAPTGPCANLKGEIINLRDYADDAGKTYIAIRTANLGAIQTAAEAAKRSFAEGDRVFSFGEFPKHSNEENFCVVPEMSTAQLHLAAAGTSPAVDRAYEWSDVEILVTSRAAGTQMKANLKYTDNVAGCSANYDVVAMWPAISCATSATNRTPDNTKCATKADPEKGIKVGCAGANCLSPDIKTHCDPELLLCVLDGTPPQFAE